MSEQTKEAAQEPVRSAPAIDVSAIQTQAVEAARQAAIEAAQQTQAQTQEMLEAHRKQVARAYGFEKEEDEINPALRLLLGNPQESLTYVKNQAKSEALAELRQELEEKEQTKYAVGRVFGSRPDIATDAMNVAVVRGFLDQVDESLPLEDRLRYAVTAYDRFMDQKVGQTAQERIAAAGTVPGASGYRGGNSQELARQVEKDSWKQELNELHERRSAQRNNF